MSPRSADHLHQARRDQSRHKRERVLAALRQMQRRGEDITFAAVARRAHVSQWLTYADGIREHIDTARAHQATHLTTSATQAPSPGTASLRTDLELARAEITALRHERGTLRDAVRHHLGHQLDTQHTGDLITRIDELTATTRRLNTDNEQLAHDNTALRHQLTDAEDSLAGARTSLRQMIKDQNADAQPTITGNSR